MATADKHFGRTSRKKFKAARNSCFLQPKAQKMIPVPSRSGVILFTAAASILGTTGPADISLPTQ
jgi:hypothetical protein